MSEDPPGGGFHRRPRTVDRDPGTHLRQIAELHRIRERLERAARDGEAAFVADPSDSHDIGTLAIINLADFVARELPPHIVAQLPTDAVQGLRRTRNIAAHAYAELDNGRLWLTVSTFAPALLATIAEALAADEATSSATRPSRGDAGGPAPRSPSPRPRS